MKKLVLLFLCLPLVFSLIGCGTASEPVPSFSELPTESIHTLPTEVTTPAVDIPEGAVSMIVMSYNLLGKTKADYPVIGDVNTTEEITADLTVETRGPKVNAMLNGEQIDIAGLQEVSAAWQEWLDDGLDSKYRYFGTATADTNEGGFVIYRADKYKLLDSGAFWLAPGAPTTSQKGWDAKYDRLCAWGILQIQETDSYLIFMNTHLDHQGIQARIEGAKIVIQQVEVLQQMVFETYGIENCPLILVGDMNTNATHTVHSIYAEKLNDAFSVSMVNSVDPKASTSPDLHYVSSVDHIVKDMHRIDYIYTSMQNFGVEEYKMIQTSTNLCEYGSYMSDHNAIIADLYII